MSRRRKVLLGIAVVLVPAVAFGLYWFQPWKLWVDERVDEALPSVVAQLPATPPSSNPSSAPGTATPTSIPTSTPMSAPSSAPSSAAPGATEVSKPEARILSRGSLISHEHDTRGAVSIVRQADGSRVLVLQDLDTSNGPDVEVWLTDAPVIPGEKGWYVFDDGAHVSLGDLKGNLGNQVYRIPDDVRLDRYTSVSLWCARFDVSFGAAELRSA
ncbi:DM13 domain-containing protein [Jatrophihabitans fulvus]